jgi:hypothetical protein
MQWNADQLHWRTMINKSAESVFGNKVREHVAIIFGSVRSPGACDMFVAEALGFPDIFEELVMVAGTILVLQRELSPHENFIRPTWEMYTVPRL